MATTRWTQIKDYYQALLQDDFWPYWRQYDDPLHGGVLNCISNDGSTLISEDKFAWSQGRYLWMLAQLLELSQDGLLPKLDPAELLDCLERSRGFARRCISDDQRVYYLLDRQGAPQPEPTSGEYYASIFADSFIIIGLANAARVTGNEDDLPLAIAVYHSVVQRIRVNNIRTAPYAIPQGYRSHSIPMILLNTSVELAKALERFAPDYANDLAQVQATAEHCANELAETFHDPSTGLMREYVSTDANYETQLQDRHTNPGHAIENAWFLLEHHTRQGTLDQHLPWLERMAENSWTLGWDQEYGGLLRYVDRAGGEPRGESGGSAFETLISSTWDMKLWWPHSETLYTFLKLYSLTGKPRYLEIYEESADYIFRTFPDPVHGEWIQIRDRRGQAEEKVVALPVKDPFHIVRNLCLVLRLADDES